jgi:hypothetical protein
LQDIHERLELHDRVRTQYQYEARRGRFLTKKFSGIGIHHAVKAEYHIEQSGVKAGATKNRVGEVYNDGTTVRNTSDDVIKISNGLRFRTGGRKWAWDDESSQERLTNRHKRAPVLIPLLVVYQLIKFFGNMLELCSTGTVEFRTLDAKGFRHTADDILNRGEDTFTGRIVGWRCAE